MTVPGVKLIAAATFLAAVGSIERFPDRRKLVAYLGLDPKVRQSGDAPATHGHISKQGSAAVRVAPVQASWSAVRPYERIRARRGHQIAITAAARKRACLLCAALAPTGRRLRPALTDRQEAPPPGDRRGRAALARAPRRLDRASLAR
jgi:transposase